MQIKLSLLFIFFLNFFFSFSQIDEIKKSTGESIICKVDSINPSHIFFHYPNESEIKYISKISTDYIRYHSGRIYKIENTEKYPLYEKESFIKSCFEKRTGNFLDTVNQVKKLNYCLASFNTIESKLSYKELYKLSYNVNDVFFRDFMMDVYLLHSEELANSSSYLSYLSFINENSNILCDCIKQKSSVNSDISKLKIDCDRLFLQTKMQDEKYLSNLLFTIFKDTTISYIGEVVGKNLLEDIEKSLYDECEVYLAQKIFQRQKEFDKIKSYNADSLRNKLNSLLNENTTSLDENYYLNRGLLYFYLGDFDKSISDYNISYKIKQRSIVLYLKSQLYDFINDFDNSIEFLKEFSNTSKISSSSRILLLEKLKSTQSNRNP